MRVPWFRCFFLGMLLSLLATPLFKLLAVWSFAGDFNYVVGDLAWSSLHRRSIGAYRLALVHGEGAVMFNWAPFAEVDLPVPVLRAISQAPPSRPWMVEYGSFGWPLPALYYVATRPRSGPWTISGGFEIPWRAGGDPKSTALPLMPMWGGIVVNGAVTGAFLLGVRSMFLYGRGRWRRRLGLCRSCRYDITGVEVCPECGTPVGAWRMKAGLSQVTADPIDAAERST